MLKITEAEMDLREETREAAQVRWALSTAEQAERSKPLAGSQHKLTQRVKTVIEDIRQLPDAEEKFARELSLLTRVTTAMKDARTILGRADTGPAAVAAETEAIELLLQARRASGGGGGGSTPGGGNSGGTTEIAALALVGRGTAEDAQTEPRTVSQSAGASAPVLPEEYRRGIELLFNELENEK